MNRGHGRGDRSERIDFSKSQQIAYLRKIYFYKKTHTLLFSDLRNFRRALHCKCLSGISRSDIRLDIRTAKIKRFITDGIDIGIRRSGRQKELHTSATSVGIRRESREPLCASKSGSRRRSCEILLPAILDRERARDADDML